MAKETIENKTEKQTAIKDSMISSSLYTSEDTTFTNEETTIHQVAYDTSKTDSDGNHPIKSITNITKKRASGSKGKVLQTLAFTKIKNIKQVEKQKTVSEKEELKKSVSPVKEAGHLVKNIILLIVIIGIGYFTVKYRSKISTFAKKESH